MTEEEIRLEGFEWQNVERAFLWSELSKDFIRELVEYDPTYKTQLEHHLLMAFHGYASFASYFYKNMYTYLNMGLAEQKELVFYASKIYMMYREKEAKEIYANRQIFQARLIDYNGTVLDTITY